MSHDCERKNSLLKSCLDNGTQCTNTQGSYTCGHCDTGFTLDNGSCVDFDEVGKTSRNFKLNFSLSVPMVLMIVILMAVTA